MRSARFAVAQAPPLARLLTGAAMLASGAHAHGAEGCPPIAFGPPHDSLDELAAKTLQELFDAGGRYESGGFMVRQGGSYYASRPVTQQERLAVNYCIVLPRNARLAGLYHTHVVSAELSPRDRSNAERAGVPSYIGALRDRSILVYDGRRRDLRAMGPAPGARGAAGTPTAVVAAEQGAARDGSQPSALGALKGRAAVLVEKLQKFLRPRRAP